MRLSLHVQRTGRHRELLVTREAGSLFLLADHNAYAGPTIMPQSRRRSRAQGHNADILCGEWIPCFEVISNELRACVGPGKSRSRRCSVRISLDHDRMRENRISE